MVGLLKFLVTPVCFHDVQFLPLRVPVRVVMGPHNRTLMRPKLQIIRHSSLMAGGRSRHSTIPDIGFVDGNRLVFLVRGFTTFQMYLILAGSKMWSRFALSLILVQPQLILGPGTHYIDSLLPLIRRVFEFLEILPHIQVVHEIGSTRHIEVLPVLFLEYLHHWWASFGKSDIVPGQILFDHLLHFPKGYMPVIILLHEHRNRNKPKSRVTGLIALKIGVLFDEGDDLGHHYFLIVLTLMGFVFESVGVIFGQVSI